MSKEKLLDLLRQRQGDYVSGNELGIALGVSRAAIWKMIQALRAQGYQIESRTNKGYFLLQGSHKILPEEIKRHLHTTQLGHPLRLLRTADSTNTLARQEAANGAKEGLTLIALQQTQGRGRHGRTFSSPCGGIYLSVLLRPDIRLEELTLITLAGAVSVAQATEELLDIHPGIKWVNDLLLDGKKLCGILTEASMEAETGQVDHVVVGIGINVDEAPVIDGPVKSCALSQFTTREIDKNELIARILSLLEEYLFEIGKGERQRLLQAYRSRLILLDKDIFFELEGRPCRAHVTGLDEGGGLVVTLADKTTRVLRSGEVSIPIPPDTN